MKKLSLLSTFLLSAMTLMAENKNITSPDGRWDVTVYNDNGLAEYSVTYDGKQMLTRSRLGLNTNVGDYTQNLTMTGAKTSMVSKEYDLSRSKTSHVKYSANTLTLDYKNAKGNEMSITFNVSNNDIAFRYTLERPGKKNPKCAVVYSETSSFNFPDKTTTFLTPQAKPFLGWERTKPSYEEEYTHDAPMTQKSKYGVGYTFPALFHVGTDGWVQVSETGVDGGYCGARLSDYVDGKGYKVAYPQEMENNGVGSTSASIMLPGSTPWRTITVGSSLKPIVETTVQYDVVDEKYAPSQAYQPGRYTWSWLIWQDNSICYDDQVRLIDVASAMGYEYCLVDGLWDTQIGYENIEKLAAYAKTKNVSLLLWYNSNGSWNDAPQGPRGVMNNAIARKRDMKWMKSIGVKGIKVDFFGGDKQETMRLYEDILSDANDYGLQVIFHGCTIPRGWEKMYPNYVASEAALASENAYFSDYHAQKEGEQLSTYAFTRNAVGSFDWGGVIMNRHMSRDNKSRHRRYTSDTFEMATAITNQSSVNCVALYPNNLTELKPFQTDYLKALPTTWDETRFIDGYPAKYFIVARRHGNDWHVAGINATAKPMTLTLNLDMLAGKTVKYYTDRPTKNPNVTPEPTVKSVKVNAKGKVKVTMQPQGAFILQ